MKLRKIVRWAVWGGLLLAVCLILFCVMGAASESTEPEVVYYSLPAAVETEICIVQLTDLHGWEFGEGNRVLIEMVTEAAPDFIMMTGDMMDRDEEGPEVVCALIRSLTEIAPVYYGYGNHEYAWMTNHGESLTPLLEAAGAVVLDVAYTDIVYKGQQLRIGGYHGYYRQPHMFVVTEEERQRQLDFCVDFENTDRYKILLSHIPSAWLDWGYIEQFPVDLVLSGHYHGGQIRLPLLGGVYAPEAGLFPDYTEGLYVGSQATCILSTGLGASPGIPRINNLPELTVVNLTPKTH